MKLKKNLITLYLLLVVYKTISLNEAFRRHEMIISGFKDNLYSFSDDAIRYAEVTFNGVIVFTKILSNDTDDRTDDFVYQATANEYDPTLDLGGYFEKNESHSNLVYSGPLEVNLTYFINSTGQRENLEIFRLATDIRCAANADRFRHFKGLRVEFDFYISYWCKGYTGKGCQYECDDSESTKFECLYETGEKICIGGLYTNPPDCNIFNTTCLKNICENNGTCFSRNPDYSYCECLPGYTGDRCEMPNCDQPCNPDFGRCIDVNVCECIPGRTGNSCENIGCLPGYCKNDGVCFIFNDEALCNCIPTQYTGKNCEFKCEPSCLFGTCMEYKGTASCQCYEGFFGPSCNETATQPAALFESGYISPRNQTLIYILVTIGLVAVAAVLFGLGSTIRKKRKDNKKVVAVTQLAVQSLSMMQQRGRIINETAQA